MTDFEVHIDLDGRARPKASVVDQHGHLAIAKFPKETDGYSMETWEEIALRLAGLAGIATPEHTLLNVAGKAVMLSRRFDRHGAIRVPFLSAMAMMGASDESVAAIRKSSMHLSNMARRERRTRMLCIDASSSTYSSRMSMTTCAITASSGVARQAGRSLRLMTSIPSRQISRRGCSRRTSISMKAPARLIYWSPPRSSSGSHCQAHVSSSKKSRR